ncbi:MAG: homoserine dehydrogenase [Methanomassiliicoccales archaeon PtaU1.Bin124]|nr:MAG: homoserine dehydrogenase [Methanomassiliicoccales archaeon PtaU1.Bin124]
MDVVLVGFGTVGQGVAESIYLKNNLFQEGFGDDLRVVAAFDSKTYVIDKKGLDPIDLVKAKTNKGVIGQRRKEDIKDMLPEIEYDVLVEMTPTNIVDARPGLDHFRAALSAGKDIVTSNKGPLALKFRELSRLAQKNRCMMRFEASVGGATPVINLASELLKCERISSIRGIMNGTCNFILSRMESEGLPWEPALREAQQMGFAETDPSYDIDGIDSACKVAILANAIMNKDVTVHDVERTGIRGINLDAVNLAAQEKKVVRLIGEITEKGVEVAPRLIPRGHPLSISGTLNTFHIQTDLAGEITVAGRGAGRYETASAVMSDLWALMRARKGSAHRH